MQGFLTRMIDQQLRRLAVGATIVMAAVIATAVATGRRIDAPRFYEAHIAVERAQLLLTSTPCGEPGQKSTQVCDKLMKRAQDLLSKTRDAISAAATAAERGATGH